MELIIGRIENCKNSKILVVHNKKLAEKIKEFNQKITIKKYLDGIEIIPGGIMHTTLGANKRLRITITKLLQDKLIKIHDKNQLNVFVNLKKWKIEKKELYSKGKGDPSTILVPNDLVRKNAAIKKGPRTYYVDVSSKPLYNRSKNTKINCLFNRLNNDLVLVRSDEKEARKMTPHSKKRIQIAIPKNMLNKREIKILSSKSWCPIILQLNIKSFGLKMEDFFSIKEEKEMVKFLTKKGIKIKIKNSSDPYDFLINDNIALEVHNSLPKYGDLVTRHKVRSGMVRLRILEADFLTKKELISCFFLIINKEWEKGKYIQELISQVNDKVVVLFTDFKEGWNKIIGEKIIKEINN